MSMVDSCAKRTWSINRAKVWLELVLVIPCDFELNRMLLMGYKDCALGFAFGCLVGVKGGVALVREFAILDL